MYMLTPTGKAPDHLKPVSVTATMGLLKWGKEPWISTLRERGVDYDVTPAEDYALADRLMSELVVDYPGGSHFDALLLKWAVIKHKLGDREEALELLAQILRDYPDSPSAEQAAALKKTLEAP